MISKNCQFHSTPLTILINDLDNQSNALKRRYYVTSKHYLINYKIQIAVYFRIPCTVHGVSEKRFKCFQKDKTQTREKHKYFIFKIVHL